MQSNTITDSKITSLKRYQKPPKNIKSSAKIGFVVLDCMWFSFFLTQHTPSPPQTLQGRWARPTPTPRRWVAWWATRQSSAHPGPCRPPCPPWARQWTAWPRPTPSSPHPWVRHLYRCRPRPTWTLDSAVHRWANVWGFWWSSTDIVWFTAFYSSEGLKFKEIFWLKGNITFLLKVPLRSKMCFSSCAFSWMFEPLCAEWCMFSLFLHSSAEGGKFLCARIKSEFKVCTCKHDLWHHS